MHPLFGIPVGLVLSAAAGLRVFIPLLLTGVAARLGMLPLSPGMAWIGSDVAVVAFATATALEIVAYYVPWLDNLLDTISAPAAVTAGIMITRRGYARPSAVPAVDARHRRWRGNGWARSGEYGAPTAEVLGLHGGSWQSARRDR